MSILDIGKIKFTWKGAYVSSTAYEKDDVVSHNGDSWICLSVSPITNVTPQTSNNLYWDKMAQGSNLGIIPNLSQGDLVYYDGSDFERLENTAVHTQADRRLKATADGAGKYLEFEEIIGSRFKVQIQNDNSSRSFSTSWSDYSQMTRIVNPTSATQLFIMFPRIHIQLSNLGGAIRLHVYNATQQTSTYLYDPGNTYQYYDSSGSQRMVTSDVWHWLPGADYQDTFHLTPQVVRYSSGSLVVNESNYYWSTFTVLESY